MNRITVRGVGFAAAAVAATSLVWTAPGATSSRADASTSSHRATLSASDALFSTNVGDVEPSSVEAARLHAAYLQTAHAGDRARARRAAQIAHRAHVLRLQRLAQEHANAAASTRASRSATRYVAPGSIRALGRSMAAARGWTGEQFSCLDNIYTHESHWNPLARNPSSGAYGIPQAQPASKLATAGSDWRTNPATQIAWGLHYIAKAYGSPCAAWAFWQDHSWY